MVLLSLLNQRSKKNGKIMPHGLWTGKKYCSVLANSVGTIVIVSWFTIKRRLLCLITIAREKLQRHKECRILLSFSSSPLFNNIFLSDSGNISFVI